MFKLVEVGKIAGIEPGDMTKFETIAVADIGKVMGITFTISNLYDRGIFMGGNDGSVSNVIDYVTITTTGNATDFGDMIAGTQQCAPCSSTTRSIAMGGETA